MRFVADGYNLWSLIVDSAALEVFLTDAVDHMLFSRVLRTDDVELIIFPDLVANIHINNIVSVVKSKYWVGDVPKHEVSLDGVDCEAEVSQGDDEHGDDVLHVDMLLLERSHILTVVSTTLSWDR